MNDSQGNNVLTFSISKKLSDVSGAVEQTTDLKTCTSANVTPNATGDQGAYYEMETVVPLGTNTKLFLRFPITEK